LENWNYTFPKPEDTCGEGKNNYLERKKMAFPEGGYETLYTLLEYRRHFLKHNG
jgi:hypothetical protein